jgi:histidine triad (HIT) family protein
VGEELDRAIAEVKRQHGRVTMRADELAPLLPEHLQQPFWERAVDRFMRWELGDDPCVFCEIVAEREPAVFVRRWTDAVAIVPLEPVVDGHVLVLPRVHVPDATDHPETTALVMRRAASLAVPPCNLITSAGREATQSVFHLHVHIVPRRENDGLALPWYSGRSRRGGGSDG